MMYDFPKPDDELFRHDQPDWVNNAVLNYNFKQFPPYADGYRMAAETLINACTNDRGTNDILIYPIVFNYRQFIELRLKEIIIGLNYCKASGDDFPKTHRIDLLWEHFKRLYTEFEESENQDDFINAEKVIKQFFDVDPQSMSFRYPVDKEGNASLNITHINIRNFGEVMGRLANFLDAISDQTAHYRDIASEMFREFYYGE